MLLIVNTKSSAVFDAMSKGNVVLSANCGAVRDYLSISTHLGSFCMK